MESDEGASLGKSSSASADSLTSPVPEKPKTLKILSPAAGDPLIFNYHSPNLDFIEILKLAFEECEGIKLVVKNSCPPLDTLYSADYETLLDVSQKFNKAANTISALWKGATQPGNNSDLASNKLLSRILQHSYNKAVDNEKSLNKHYEAFSSETYGETSYERMQMIIDELKPTSQDVFVDLGSGVGQLVAQMAGGSRVKKAFGIEIAHLPAKFAAKLEEEFRKLMKFFGKKVRPFSLEKGNFLDESYRDLITQEASIIFINNYAFKAELDAQIKDLLLRDLKSGTRIITTKAYGSLNKNGVTERQLNDISAILDIVELARCPNSVSWTSADVPYYLHTVNHEKLEKYFKSRKDKAENRRSDTPSSSRNTNSPDSVELRRLLNADDEFGPTTRRKWKVQNYVPKSPKHEPDSGSEDEAEKKKKKPGPKKGRPRKAAEKVNKKAKLYPCDQRAVDLMHTLTCAVSEGRPVPDIVNPFAGDSSDKKSKKIKVSDLASLALPFPEEKPESKVAKVLEKTEYPNLEIFLGELRNIYTRFLDSMSVQPRPAAGQQRKKKVSTEEFNELLNNMGHDFEQIREDLAALKRLQPTENAHETNGAVPTTLNPPSISGFSTTTTVPATNGINGNHASAMVENFHSPAFSAGYALNGTSSKPEFQSNGSSDAQSRTIPASSLNSLTSLLGNELMSTPPINFDFLGQINSMSQQQVNQLTANLGSRNQALYSVLANANNQGLLSNTPIANLLQNHMLFDGSSAFTQDFPTSNSSFVPKDANLNVAKPGINKRTMKTSPDTSARVVVKQRRLDQTFQ